MYTAWEVGVWMALRDSVQIDVIVGTSAGAWNGWAISGGCSPDELIQDWLNPEIGRIMQVGLHRHGFLNPANLQVKARELFTRFQPRTPFALTLAEVPRLRPLIVRGPEVTWQHLAAVCSIPMAFPPVRIAGKQYVDGGLLGALPVWAAEEMGATHVIAVNALTTLPFRMLRVVLRPRRPSSALKVFAIEPSTKLGPFREGLIWSPSNIHRWIEQGQRDGKRAATSITM
jgi:predicted acylesterase/phospholipase RssA